MTKKLERKLRGELRKKFGRNYRDKFEIRTNSANRAISVHWRGDPDERIIQTIGKPLVTALDGDGLWFFQTHHNE